MADYEGEVSRFEDRYPDKENTVKEKLSGRRSESDSRHSLLKSPSPTGQVWKLKLTSELNYA